MKRIRYRFQRLCDETVGTGDYNINIIWKADELIDLLDELKATVERAREKIPPRQ